MEMTLTEAELTDLDRIRALHLRAFGETEGKLVADCAAALLTEASDPSTIHLVAGIEGAVVGHVAFSPVRRKRPPQQIGHLLAPLAVEPAWQQRGVGSALVREGLRRLRLSGSGIVFVYGDPAYYGRFGFTRELAARFVPPHPLTQPAGWQALGREPRPGADGPVAIECVAALASPALW